MNRPELHRKLLGLKIKIGLIVYDRLHNLQHWLYCWKQCEKLNAELVVIHTGEDERFKELCLANGVTYVRRKNKGYDIGAFQDVCKERLEGFPNDWDLLFWITDDTFPMRHDFLFQYAHKMLDNSIGISCMHLSREIRRHVRTTGFCIRKTLSKNLNFLAEPIITKGECYEFEHGLNNMLFQAERMGYKCGQPLPIMEAAVWDMNYGLTAHRRREHGKAFPKGFIEKPSPPKEAAPLTMSYIKSVNKICITTTFDRHYKEAGKTLFNSIRRHTNCNGIDFKVITSDIEVVNELGKENCHFITEEIKARYSNVQYSEALPVEKYASSWYRYEIFNMTDYDRVICIDSDCICVQDISYLFSEALNEYDLISVEDHIVSKCFNNLVPELERQGLRLANLTQRMSEGKIDIQPALLVANKSIVNEAWYKKLLHYANTAPFSYSIDEGVLNDFIYMENLKIKLLPLEWDYQDIYELVCPTVPVPDYPVIVHCQESKPFKREKANLDQRMHKWHDMWWEENKPIPPKTLVVVIVWSRFENLRLWVNCWNQCEKSGAELVVIHNLEKDNDKYLQLCKENGIAYVPRENKGFDLGAFQDVCKERLNGFPNNWDKLIWVTDDCIPMSKNFVGEFLDKLSDSNIPCYEISDEVKRHVRTTGFLVTKEIANKLTFPQDPIDHREHCYEFEHKSKTAFYEQIISMGKTPVMVNTDLKQSPLWDAGVRGHLNLMRKHESIFTPIKSDTPHMVINSILDDFAIAHKSDKSSRFHNYAVKYDKILSPYREAFTSILEIGVAQGQSIRMWTDYFTKAIIHGADISKPSESCVDYSADRIKFHLLDQRDRAQLKNMEQYSPFDLIIDDGNHFWMEQILTFETLFPYLRSGGIYIVEDTTTSYWQEYKNHPISPVDYFKGLADEVNLMGRRGSVPINPPKEFSDWEKGWHRMESCHVNVPDFESIQFFNGFVVIFKR